MKGKTVAAFLAFIGIVTGLYAQTSYGDLIWSDAFSLYEFAVKKYNEAVAISNGIDWSDVRWDGEETAKNHLAKFEGYMKQFERAQELVTLARNNSGEAKRKFQGISSYYPYGTDNYATLNANIEACDKLCGKADAFLLKLEDRMDSAYDVISELEKYIAECRTSGPRVALMDEYESEFKEFWDEYYLGLEEAGLYYYPDSYVRYSTRAEALAWKEKLEKSVAYFETFFKKYPDMLERAYVLHDKFSAFSDSLSESNRRDFDANVTSRCGEILGRLYQALQPGGDCETVPKRMKALLSKVNAFLADHP